jgi:transcriptional regulator with GAF, ATPase, and Fis domain
MLTLVVENAGRRSTMTFPGEMVTMGRAEDNDLRISSRFVSQHHCRIESTEAAGAKLIDLDSQNGTRLNGDDVSQARLRLGDCIEIGPVRIWFGQAPSESTASLEGATDEMTDPGDEDVQISTRAGTGVGARLRDALTDVVIDYRKNFGDERGITEVEEAVLEITRRVFPRPAFQRSLETARLVSVTRAMTASTSVTTVLNLIMDAAIEITDAERGFLVLRDESGQWKVRTARNFDQEAVRGAEHKISRSIAQQVAKTGKPVCAVNAQDDDRLQAFASVAELRLRSILCLPLTFRDRVIGTLYLDNRFNDGVFGERELSLMECFADQAAIAIENARLYSNNVAAEAELTRQKEELDDLARVLDNRMKEATEANAEDMKPLSREGLKHDYSMIIGESPAMIEMFRLLDRVAESDIPVLITGESGSGKELVAQSIHRSSKRNNQTFLTENCAAIPESLMESEFFGYHKGAFTGAHADRKGLFQQAHKGTLFLDEIGEMSLEMQSKMLRVLQNGEIRPVGSRETVHVDVRLITATNRNLRQMVEEGRFREDLFYRLNVICVEAPPLRDRLEDVPLLVDFFLQKAAEDTGTDPKSIDPFAMRYLLSYHWPGNVRELQNEVQRAVALSGPVITADDLAREITVNRHLEGGSGSGGLKEMVKLATHQKEREIILRTLEECQWRKSLAAKKLMVSRPTLDQKIKIFGLTPFIEKGRQRTEGPL